MSISTSGPPRVPGYRACEDLEPLLEDSVVPCNSIEPWTPNLPLGGPFPSRALEYASW